MKRLNPAPRGAAALLAAVLVVPPGCLSWQVSETTVPGSERQTVVSEWQELRARPWNRIQNGALPIRLELHGARHEESARTVTRQVELDVWSVTGAVVKGATSGGGEGALAIVVLAPFTLVTDLLLLMFSPPTLPFTVPDDPDPRPQPIVEQGEVEQVLEPLPVGTGLSLDWGEGIERQRAVMPNDGMLYLRFGAQSRQALGQGRSSIRLGIVPDEPVGLRAAVTVSLPLLVDAAAAAIETGDELASRQAWEEILAACPSEAEDVRAAVEDRLTSLVGEAPTPAKPAGEPKEE